MQEVYEFLKKCGTYYLATVDGDTPKVRPFGTIDIFEDKLYIQTGKKKEVSKQIHKNPNVEICAFDGNKYLYDDRFVITFNYKGESKTVTLDDINNSSLTSMGSPLKYALLSTKTKCVFFMLFGQISEKSSKIRKKRASEQSIGCSGVRFLFAAGEKQAKMACTFWSFFTWAATIV